MTVYYITREVWGGGPVRSGHSVPHSRFIGLAIHHTVMVMSDYDRDGYLNGDMDDIKRYMRQLQRARPDLSSNPNLPEVPYSFVVFRGAQPDDCVVAAGRGFGRTGAHTSGYNSTRYGVAYAGDATNLNPTPGEISGFNWVGRQLYHPETAARTFGHRDVDSTACPGDGLYRHIGLIQPPFGEVNTEQKELEVGAVFTCAGKPAVYVFGPAYMRLNEMTDLEKLQAEHARKSVPLLIHSLDTETYDEFWNNLVRS